MPTLARISRPSAAHSPALKPAPQRAAKAPPVSPAALLRATSSPPTAREAPTVAAGGCAACKETGSTGCSKCSHASAFAPKLARPASPAHAAAAPSSDVAERQADELGALLGRELGASGSLRSGPLPPSVAAVAERHLGVRVEGAEVQAGPEAQAIAARQRALAVTEGNVIRFAGALPSLNVAEDRALLGHEIVHVAQQRAHGLAVAQRKAIKDTPLASKLTHVSLKKLTKPKMVRQDNPGKPSLDVLMTEPLKVEATAQFTPGPHLAGLKFGFFQLGRPYELYRATQHKMGAPDSSPDADLDLNLTSTLRSKLPMLDHSLGKVFFESRGSPPSVSADATGKVSATYSDQVITPFQKEIENPPGTYYGLSGVAAQSFFFTAFGAIDGSDPIILATFYWDLRHCEALTPSDVRQKFKLAAPVTVAPFRYCNTGGCDLGEPGADKFGTAAAGSFLRFVEATILPDMKSPSAYAGPGAFTIGCKKS